MTDRAVLNIIYTNIGRGHPFYLEGIVHELQKTYSNEIRLNIDDVFGLSSGMSLWLWKLVRSLYHAGSQGGVVGRFYEGLRKRRGAGDGGLVTKLLAAGIRKYVGQNRYPTLVAHPLLVPMLADLVPVYYMHGEHAVPPEAAVTEAAKIFVPTERAAEAFVDKGITRDKILISGLGIEDFLAGDARNNFHKRLERLRGDSCPVGGFFSSGAEPRGHIDIIIGMLLSLQKAGCGAIVHCRKSGHLASRAGEMLQISPAGPEEAVNKVQNSITVNNIIIITYNSRNEENEITEKLFRYFDYIAAPSHERSNWALGLGLPLFILHPIIGTFSPLNRKLMLDHETACDIDSATKAADFSSILMHLKKEGILENMARNGYEKYSIDGFVKCARFLAGEMMEN